ncbi:MAG: type II secretion system protein M [Oceanicaulis sp.]|nr:type II secretion system protein M [Oceanicaulis sp.]
MSAHWPTVQNGRLGVWMEQADANAVLAWLDALAREQGVVVERISLDREADERVRAQLTLRRVSEAN